MIVNAFKEILQRGNLEESVSDIIKVMTIH